MVIFQPHLSKKKTQEMGHSACGTLSWLSHEEHKKTFLSTDTTSNVNANDDIIPIFSETLGSRKILGHGFDPLFL